MANRLVFTVVFTLFLLPLQFQGLSVNYSFFLLPVLVAAITGRMRIPPAVILASIALYTAIFLGASFYQLDHLDDSVRRTTSFLIFVGAFTYSFVSIDSDMTESFKIAIVAVSGIVSAYTMYMFFAAGGSALGFEAKVLVGSQRFGFVYLLAFWLAFLYQPKSVAARGLRYAVILLILVGLLLTFSRSSILSLATSFGLFFLVAFADWIRRPAFAAACKVVFIALMVAVMVWCLYSIVPLAFEFFSVRLLMWLSDPSSVSSELADIYSSAGTRLFLMRQIVSYVAENPLTGSGFLGVWILPGLSDHFVSSAHNQYTDVLFRTGIPGFATYALLLILVSIRLFKKNRDLFWGFVAVLCYGMFHETFKLSQGGFVLAFFLGMLDRVPRSALFPSFAAAAASSGASRYPGPGIYS